MRLSVETCASVLVVLAAVAVATASLHREFGRRHDDISVRTNTPPTYLPTWTSLGDHGVLVGDSAAPLKIIEFADLECPFCKRFNASIDELRKQRGSQVALIYIHYPLTIHRFARPAARAAECAGAQGRFGQFEDVVYDKQDSLGLKSWSAYAEDAGVADTNVFLRCVRETRAMPRVEDGLATGRALNVRGTPTVIINGWRFATPPYDSLGTIAARLLSGLTPDGSPQRRASR